MCRIAVLGDKESVFGFAALGLDVHFSDCNEEAIKIFKRLTQSNYAVIYITEPLAEFLNAEIAKLHYKPAPAIILIPGISGNTGKGMADVRLSVEKAVGSDIFSDD